MGEVSKGMNHSAELDSLWTRICGKRTLERNESVCFGTELLAPNLRKFVCAVTDVSRDR